MAALILKLGSRWRSVVIFMLRPLYHREVRPDTHWVGHRGGSVILEKISMVLLLSCPLSSVCLSVCLCAFLSVCISFVPLLSLFHISFPPIFPVFVSSFYLILSFFIFCYFLFSHIFCLIHFYSLFCPFVTVKPAYSTYRDSSCLEQLSPCTRSWKIFQA